MTAVKSLSRVGAAGIGRLAAVAAMVAGVNVGAHPYEMQAPPSTSHACLAIILPEVGGVPRDAIEVGTAVQQLFKTFLAGTAVEVVILDARLMDAATAEAEAKQCNRIVSAKLVAKYGRGGLGRVLGTAASTAAWFAPGGASLGSAVARGAAIGGAQAVAEMAATTRAKDEIRLDYRIVDSRGAVTFGPKTEKTSARIDGEDLLTPTVRRASEAIASWARSSPGDR